ncbi:MAG TPA: HAD-IC family P-type ATPase, partial [Phycisphaeraceae bacterium]
MLPAVLVAVCLAGTLIGWWFGAQSPAGLTAFALAYLAGGAGPTVAMIAAIRSGQITVDSLMIAAAAGAAIIGDWVEGAGLLFLFSFSGALESYAMYRTTRSIRALVQLRPREATLVRDGQDQTVPVETLSVGDIVRVRPGERFAVDGEVIEGASWADESTITGESLPVQKSPGDAVFAGTINGQGSVLVRMTRAAEDTTLERIIRLVQEAQSEKTPSQRLVESWQRPYVLGVFGAAAVVFVGSWLVRDRQVADAFYQAMVLLVATSPCAVVASAPAVVLSAIARAALRGVLFKGGLHLERLSQVEWIALDKTGTITVGKPSVTEVLADGAASEAEILAWAAAVEQASEHP